MLLEYQEFDIVGKNFSVKNPSELGSQKRSCYQRDIHHLKIGCGLVYFVKFSDGLWQFFPWFWGFERFASSHMRVRDMFWKGLHLGTGKIAPFQSWCSYFFEATNQILYFSHICIFMYFYIYYPKHCPLDKVQTYWKPLKPGNRTGHSNRGFKFAIWEKRFFQNEKFLMHYKSCVVVAGELHVFSTRGTKWEWRHMEHDRNKVRCNKKTDIDHAFWQANIIFQEVEDSGSY